MRKLKFYRDYCFVKKWMRIFDWRARKRVYICNQGLQVSTNTTTTLPSASSCPSPLIGRLPFTLLLRCNCVRFPLCVKNIQRLSTAFILTIQRRNFRTCAIRVIKASIRTVGILWKNKFPSPEQKSAHLWSIYWLLNSLSWLLFLHTSVLDISVFDFGLILKPQNSNEIT